MRILGADIGGTNSRFGHFRLDEAGRLVLEGTTWLATREAGSLGELLEMLAASGFSLPPAEADAVALAVACAVQQGVRCDPVNIDWSVDLAEAKQKHGLKRSILLNDFEAQAHACSTQAVVGAREILPGDPAPEGTVGVIGAGTGLGKCALVSLPGGGHLAVPSEGGHSDFPFVCEEEHGFARFLRRETNRHQLIGDIVVSGMGLKLLHRYLTGQTMEPAEIAGMFELQESQATGTLRWFARFYGRSCRNYALEVLATGGLFVAGGVAARAPAVVMEPAFAREFRNSETHGPLLEKIPVRLNDNQESGLWGAASVAAQRLLGVIPAAPQARDR